MGCGASKGNLKDVSDVPSDNTEVARSKLLLRYQTVENVYNINLTTPAQDGKDKN